MAKIKDLTGKRFGRLVVCRRAPSEKGARNGVYWICKCDCGRGKKILSSALLSGFTRSCGCLRSENAKRTVRQMQDINRKRRESLTDKVSVS